MSGIIAEIDPVLQDLREAARGSDKLKIQAAREDAIRELKGRVNSPAAFADAVLDGIRKDEERTGTGSELVLPDIDPWGDGVDGTELLRELESEVLKYVVVREGVSVALALWVLHCHLLDCFQISPRLAITSPVKGCGKTTLLDVLEPLVPRPLPAANLTASVMFRLVEKAGPTLLIDEADTFLNHNEELRGVLNAGHRRGGQVIRNVPVADDYEPRAFSVFSPAAIAKIGELPDTLQDRSIQIQMRRRSPGESIENFRRDRTQGLTLLGRKAARWAQDNSLEISQCDPEMPEGVFNRQADNWRPLLAIAAIVGGSWPSRAREALGHLCGDSGDGDSSVFVQLLADTRAAFEELNTDRMFSRCLVDRLCAMEDRPWPEWKRGKELTTTQLARILKRFNIKPKQIRVDGESKKGYELDMFADAFSRYLPNEPKQAKQLNNDGASQGISSRNTDGECFALESPESSIDSSIVSGVSLSEGGLGAGPADDWGEV